MEIESLSLKVPVPCTVGNFGDRLQTFQTQVRPAELINLLGHDPRSKNWKYLPPPLREVYEYLQRKTSPERRRSTGRYIEERIAPGALALGAFPAISIGVVSPVKFESYTDRFPSIGIRQGVGDIEFDLSATNLRILLDGLARVTGALDLIDDDKGDIAASFSFPVTIFAPTARLGKIDLRELGQLFHDFNFLQTPVSSGQAIDLDQSNIYIQMTSALGGTPIIADNGGVEARAKSLGGKSTALVAKQVLLRFVKGGCEGPTFQHTLRDFPDSQPNLTPLTFDHLKDRLENFLTEIGERMGKDRFCERDSLHLSSPGWNALGVLFYDIQFGLRDRLTITEQGKVFDGIATIDWSRSNPEWINLLGDPAMDDNGNELVDAEGRKKLGKLYGGQQAITKLVDYVRRRSGLIEHLAAVRASYELQGTLLVQNNVGQR